MPIWQSARKNLFVVWHHGRWYQKILFIMKPFLQDILFVWLDVWSVTPLPAVVKFALSVIIVAVMLLPVAYLVLGSLLYLGFWQYQIESLYPSVIPVQMQISHWFKQVLQVTVHSEPHVELFQRKIQHILLIVAGTIDYMRILLEII